MTNTIRSAVCVAVAGVLSFGSLGCATAPATREGPDRDPDVLTREEILTANARTLYEVIDRERPRWLRTRSQRSFGLSTGVLVYQNQTRLGGLSVLHSLNPGLAWRIEYWDSARASASLPGIGSQHVQGAIVIFTSPPDDHDGT